MGRTVSNLARALAVTAASAVIVSALPTTASALTAPTFPEGSQDFISNLAIDTIYGSGSDTLYPVAQELGTLFNRAPGCKLQTKAAGDQTYDLVCLDQVDPSIADYAPSGYLNYDRDLSVEHYYLGSGGGRNHVCQQGQANVTPADYFRSSSIPSSGSFNCEDLKFVAFARDALAAFTFTDLPGTTDAPLGASVSALTTAEVQGIWQGTIRCWTSVNSALATIPAENQNLDGSLNESTLDFTDAADRAICNPIAVYTVPTTSGTRQSWDTLAAGGTGKGELFLSVNDPFTGLPFTNEEKLRRVIPENNASPIANRYTAEGATATDMQIVRNSIYFYSVGKYSGITGQDVDGNPNLTGNSTAVSGFADKLFGVETAGGDVFATKANIASGTYTYARDVAMGYRYPTQATRQYLDPVYGFLCTASASGIADPVTSRDVRTQIETAITRNGFVPFPLGNSGRGGAQSYCRLSPNKKDDVTPPTVGLEARGGTPLKPWFQMLFNEMVFGLNAQTVGLRLAGGGATIPTNLFCLNNLQEEIECPNAMDYDRYALDYATRVVVQPVTNLVPGQSYELFARGIVGDQVVLQDRHGLTDWPIADGNPLTSFSQLVVTPPTVAHALSGTATSLRPTSTVTFSEPVAGVTAANIGLKTLGGTAISTTRHCRTLSNVSVSCTSADVRKVVVVPNVNLVPYEKYYFFTSPGVTDLEGNAAPASSASFRALRTIQENSTAVVRSSGWTSRITATALAGRHMTSSTRGVSASLKFRGTGFTFSWVGTTASGRALVYVDGRLVATLDQYATSTARRSYTKTGLTDRVHTVKIVVAGNHRAGSTGNLVSVDQFYIR